MIHPNLATMLGVIATDAAVGKDALNYLARHAAEQSFNAITIDGDTSTNDTMVLIARAARPIPRSSARAPRSSGASRSQ